MAALDIGSTGSCFFCGGRDVEMCVVAGTTVNCITGNDQSTQPLCKKRKLSDI